MNTDTETASDLEMLEDFAIGYGNDNDTESPYPSQAGDNVDGIMEEDLEAERKQTIDCNASWGLYVDLSFGFSQTTITVDDRRHGW